MKILSLIIFLLLTNNCTAQETSNWQKFLKDSVYKSDDNNYVYLYKSLGGKNQKTLNYSFKNKQYVLSTIYGDTAVDSKIILSPSLFQIVYDNYTDLIKLKNNFFDNKQFSKNFKNVFYNKSEIFTQLGIKYGQLYFNHFPRFTDEQIGNAKDKYKNAMGIINKLYAIFDKLELEETNTTK